MKSKFEVVFLQEAIEFLESLDLKTRKKIYYNIDKAKLGIDSSLFKKLTGNIWEFRTKYNGKQYRVFAFWDSEESLETLVISTHGIVKKTGKVPKEALEKAEQVRKEYLIQKHHGSRD